MKVCWGHWKMFPILFDKLHVMKHENTEKTFLSLGKPTFVQEL